MSKKLNLTDNPLLLENMDSLNTGDMILCHGSKGDGIVDETIEFFTKSPWVHAAIIIRDPWWTSPPLSGIYVFQSGDGPNSYKDVLNGHVSGVTLNKLNDFLANRHGVYVRTLVGGDVLNGAPKIMFKNAFEIAHGEPYDTNICSWIGNGLGSYCGCRCLSKLTAPKHDTDFWCSALVAFIYDKMDWHVQDDWSCQSPADLSKWSLKKPYTLTEPWLLK